MALDGPLGKHCTRCKAWKPRTEFDVRPQVHDGMESWCQDCTRWAKRRSYRRKMQAEQKARKWLAERHPDEFKELVKEARKQVK